MKYYKRNKIFSDAWKRSGGITLNESNSKLLQSPPTTPIQKSKNSNDNSIINFIFSIILSFFRGSFKPLLFEVDRQNRRDYYRNDYLKSDAWQRKRYLVLKRDNWKCVYCGANATQVHHKKYAKYNIGKEPIEWLVSICNACHDNKHS